MNALSPLGLPKRWAIAFAFVLAIVGVPFSSSFLQTALAQEPGESEPPSAEEQSADEQSAEEQSAEEQSAEEQDQEPSTQPTQTDPPTASAEEGTDLGSLMTQLNRERPPPSVKSFALAGRLIDSEDIVRGLLRPVLARHRVSWSLEAEQRVKTFLRELGYYSDIETNAVDEGTVTLTITLEPITVVRFVRLSINKPTTSRICEPIFADDLLRRMTLRPGSALLRDRAEQVAQLRTDGERLANHLRSIGYGDAEVTISSRAKGIYAAELIVSVDPGSGYRVGKINVSGNTTLSSKIIADKFRHSRNFFARAICPSAAIFSREQLAADVAEITKMYQRRGYPGVRVRHTFDKRSSFKRATKTVEFDVEIRERRRIDVQFVGNSVDFTEAILTDALTFSEEGAYDDVEVQASAASLARFYQSKGYFQASITWERYRLSANVKRPDGRSDSLERIYFYISEGPKLPVRSITIAGNDNISSKTIRGELETRLFSSVVLGRFRRGGYATSVQLEQDAARITSLYRQRGYRRAIVRVRAAPRVDVLKSAPALAAAVASKQKSTGLHVQFDIEEGGREVIALVDFLSTDLNPISITTLTRTIRQKAGEPFLEDKAAQDARALEDLYFSRGYPRAVVTPTYKRSDDLLDQVIITYEITTNSAAEIGKVALRGNFRTRPWVILDELKLSEGTPLTLRAAERAQSNLRATGLFSAVNIDYLGFDDLREETVNVIVNLEERYDYNGEIEVSGGLSSDRGPFAGLKYEHRNLFGVGLRADSSVLIGTQEQRAEAKVTIPRWVMRRALGTSFLLETSARFINEDVERFDSLQTIGAGIAATKEGTSRLFRGWLLSLRYNFRRRNRDRDLVRTAGASDNLSIDKIITRTSTLGPLLVIDKRTDRSGSPNPLSPAKGYLIELRGQYGENFVLGTDRFIKLGGSGQLYVPLGDRLLISNGLRYDHGIPLDGTSLLPDVERFFAGGDTTVRGFEEDRLASEIIKDELGPVGGLEQFRVIPAGGNIRFIHNIDLQLDLLQFGSGFNISSALFLDTGIVTNSLRGFEVRDLRHSLGMTIVRFNSPFGSLSLEWAVPLDGKLGDNPRGRLHFNVGFLF